MHAIKINASRIKTFKSSNCKVFFILNMHMYSMKSYLFSRIVKKRLKKSRLSFPETQNGHHIRLNYGERI